VVREISPATAAKLHNPGVLIESVRTGSFADLQGLEPGLVITRVNKQTNRHQGTVRCRGQEDKSPVTMWSSRFWIQSIPIRESTTSVEHFQ